MILPRGRTGFGIVLLALAAAFPATAQDLAGWFERSSGTKAYSSLRPVAEALGERLRREGLPEALLVDRLAEGASKRIPPPRLAETLEQDTARFTAIAAVLGRHGLLPADPADAGPLAAEAGLLLRAGLPLEELESAFALSSARLIPGDPARGQTACARRALAAVATANAVRVRFTLADGERSSLAAALVRSGLAVERFDSLISIYARGRAIGLTSSALTALCADSLGDGASLDRIDRELQRRTPKR